MGVAGEDSGKISRNLNKEESYTHLKEFGF